jgi:hypothetical protein
MLAVLTANLHSVSRRVLRFLDVHQYNDALRVGIRL